MIFVAQFLAAIWLLSLWQLFLVSVSITTRLNCNQKNMKKTKDTTH